MNSRCRMLWLGFILCFTLNGSVAQPSRGMRADKNLHGQLSGAGSPRDTTYINALNARAHDFYGINSDSAFFYSRKALDYAKQAGYEKGQAEGLRMLGNAYELVGDYTNMLSCYQQSLNIAERINNPRQIAFVHLNISLFYSDMGEYDAALQQMELVSSICKSDGDSLQLAYVLGDQSDIFFRRRQYDKSLQYAKQSLAIVTALKDSSFIASSNNDIGKILAANGDFKESLNHLIPSLNYYINKNNKLGNMTTSALLAKTWLSLGQYAKAIRFARQSLILARESGRKKEIREAGKVLADIYESKGDFAGALRYFKLYKDFSDSLFNESTREQTFALETRYEYAKKEILLREDAAKKDALHQQLERNHFHQISIAVLLILFLAALTITLFHRGMDKHRTNLLLQAKNEEIHRQKEEIEHQAVQLLLNNQQKDKLFSIIAHDLKVPLNSLKSLLDFLKENSLTDAEINMMMAELRRNVDYSAELVNNLLFWASSQLNGIVISPVQLNMTQLTNETMTLFGKQAADKYIILKNEIPPSLVGYADKDMIQVVIRNLISNAIKFCRAGDTITISGRMDGEAVGISVSDTGTGIKPDILEKIRRNESITTYGTAREKGTGLGMLLSREFTEENKGQFQIESHWGKGSRIYFTIPAAPSSSSISE